MKQVTIAATICLFLLTLSLASASHYIFGRVNNASDGTSPNGLSIVLWNSENGYEDHIFEIIGPNGYLGMSNVYMFDCDLLESPCRIGDTLNIKVLVDNRYKAKIATVTITGAGYDLVEDISLDKRGKPIIKSILKKHSTKTAIHSNIRVMQELRDTKSIVDADLRKKK